MVNLGQFNFTVLCRLHKLACAWQCVLHGPVHFVVCLFEGENNIYPVEWLLEFSIVCAGL